VLDADDNVGIVGGAINQTKIEHFEYWLKRKNNAIIYYKDENKSIKKKIGGVECVKYGCVFNFALMRKKIFSDVAWDDKIKIQGEHTDFYLNMAQTDWDVVYTPEVIIDHQQQFSPEYKDQRKRMEYLIYMMKKHNVNRITWEDTGTTYLLEDNKIITTKWN
jgi:GT2 family glycosyltransferase